MGSNKPHPYDIGGMDMWSLVEWETPDGRTIQEIWEIPKKEAERFGGYIVLKEFNPKKLNIVRMMYPDALYD